VKFRTEQANENGDAYLSVDAFGAQQGTVPHRDEFRGTGNSVYFMSFQDLANGGERLTVEVRDPFNDIVPKNAAFWFTVKTMTLITFRVA